MINSAVISAEGLYKRFCTEGPPTLDGVNFSVLKGEKLGIFGPNGAGKTTLISILCGTMLPDDGTLTYHLTHDASARETLKHIGYVPQEYAFFEELSPYENLRYFGGLYGIPKHTLRSRMHTLLTVMGLETVMHRKVRNFSGGMKRRLNLAIGLIHAPQILFLDEPTVGVDVQSKMAMMQYLDELNALGTTIIYTSHHLKEAEDFCDRILLLDAGRMVALNSLDRLLEEYDVHDLETCFVKLTGTAYRD